MNDEILNETLIETRNLTKIYSNGAEVRALDDVSIRVRQGEFLTVMGPSGSGKSTLLNMLGALDRPTRGEVFINGQDLTTVKDLDSFRARTVGFIFQLHNLIPTLNARENVEVPMMGQDVSARQRRQRSQELLKLVGLGQRLDHLPSQLSGGQRQRVAVARALANRPALVLADEPTGNLDTQSGAEVVDLMRELNEELGTTFVIVTHDHGVARQTERVLVMQDGRIVDDHRVGDPFEEDLKAFRDSGLGQALVEGDGSLPEWLDSREQDLLREILQQ